MTSVATETSAGGADVLCVECGYRLRGLAGDANCPECGRPVATSVESYGRATAFEAGPSVRSFIRTTRDVLLRPRAFFRALPEVGVGRRGRWFGRWHRALASVFIALAISGDMSVILSLAGGTYIYFTRTFEDTFNYRPWLDVYKVHPFLLVPFAMLVATAAHLALALLSRSLARFARSRMPLGRRIVQYHTASYTPVAFGAACIVFGNVALLQSGVVDWSSWQTSTQFSHVLLLAEVVIGLAYVFGAFAVAVRCRAGSGE